MGIPIDRDTWDKTKFCQPGQGYEVRDAGEGLPTRIIVHTTNGNIGTSFQGEARFLAESHDVGTHYLVGKSGEIARFLTPRSHIAWHAGRTTRPGWSNRDTIGIECHYTPGEGAWPGVMLDMLGALVLELCEVYPIGPLQTSVATHRWAALPPRRKIDPSGFEDMAFGIWRELLECKRQGRLA